MISEFLKVAICVVAEDYEELLDKLPSDIQVTIIINLNTVFFCELYEEMIIKYILILGVYNTTVWFRRL